MARGRGLVYPLRMTQIPYVSDPYGHDQLSEPPRTSLMAIISMVLSLIGCCLPIGFLGAILGVFSLVGISSSRGRVTGKGFAVAGIIIGVINTAIQVSLFVAMEKGFKAYVGITEPIYKNLESGDFDSVRLALSGASATTTDEQFIAFRNAYQAELGSFSRMPSGWVELVTNFVGPEIGPNVGVFQGRNDMIPTPAHFDQGVALLIFQFDPAQTSGGPPLFVDLFIVLPDGTEILLSDFASVSAVPPAAPVVPAPVDPAQPGEPVVDDEG